MSATVIKKVNTRLDASTASAKLIPLLPGDTINVKRLELGEEYRGSNLWLVDENENKYWANAFRLTTKNALSSLVDFNRIWSLQSIKKLKIGIVDTGVLKDIKLFEDRIIQLNHNDVEIVNNHATYMAAIIGGSDVENGYVGLIPNAIIFSYRAKFDKNKNEEVINPEDFIKALKKFLDLGVDIVNVSMVTSEHTEFFTNDSRFQKVIDLYMQRNIPIIAAFGNNGIYNDDLQIFPARVKNVVSISGFRVINKQATFDDSLNIFSGIGLLAPSFAIFDQEFMRKYFIDKPVGSSVASAVAAGSFGILKLIGLKNRDLGDFLNTITNTIKLMPETIVEVEGNLKTKNIKYLDFKLLTDKMN